MIAIALVPLLEWLERHRVPSALAALLCVLLFLVAANVAIAAIVVPATDFFRLLPSGSTASRTIWRRCSISIRTSRSS